MNNPLQDRTALITGAGRGIGQSLALQLAESGVKVALVARTTDQLSETAKRVLELGGTAIAISADLSDLDQVPMVLARTRDEVGSPDILINNAATVEPLGAAPTINIEDVAGAIALNVLAPTALAYGVLPPMLERGWGRIVNISSGIAASPGAMVGMNAYATSKAALEAHTLNLAAELLGTGVTVNAYRPGSVDTAMQRWIRDQDPARIGRELHDRFIRSAEEGRLLTPTHSAQRLMSHLTQDDTGHVWEASEPA